MKDKKGTRVLMFDSIKQIATSKRSAIELSIGTIVIIVIAMSMLILGLVLVKNIFGGATESVNILTDKVKSEISTLFTKEDKNVVIYLGTDRKAVIYVGTDDFGVAIGARTTDGSSVIGSRMKYKVELSESERDNCVKRLGRKTTEMLVMQSLGEWLDFREYEYDRALSIISFNIPGGTAICSQIILITVKDTQTNVESKSFFIIELKRKLL